MEPLYRDEEHNRWEVREERGAGGRINIIRTKNIMMTDIEQYHDL